ncbi:SpvB/TcaC N-terminal domain-containing protein [Mangrovivirga cuniculi]|uniref:Insecticidal toxin complex protein n=1 Tax=Mangrovivirga cuniculi TaxID=2715131 RepID=A0A4D7K354_9BACT|nr:SpvB/TcaC N-terminal domain-containing protein [Mangrovivirga cuniculi]QCK15294.1 insecticidal toxin complex protein [Mangrovivirga cuniculi]
MIDRRQESQSTKDRSVNTKIADLTDEKPSKSQAIKIPEISLPQGGGALKGIDEKFEVNPANGTASFSIQLPLSPGRNNFTPSLSLNYNSGSGNSPYGLGWSLDYPTIQRKTDKQLPKYQDVEEEDIFMFAGAEDLVPYLEKNDDGDWKALEFSSGEFQVKRYRPRIESNFSRIEKINHPDLGTYWKVTTKENKVTFFGRNNQARVADPTDNTRIYQWLAEFSYDNKGNWIQYHYKKDLNINDDGSIHEDPSIPNEVFEKNRKSGIAPFTNTYLKRVTYGNRQAYYPDPTQPYDITTPTNGDYLFELILDYGEHTNEIEPHLEESLWSYRADPFSSFRSGFEIRTQRLCHRVMMFHHFLGENDEQGYNETGVNISHPFGENYLVRSLEFGFEGSSINGSEEAEVCYLISLTQSGFIRLFNEDDFPIGYSRKDLPPMEFDYQRLQWNTNVQEIDEESLIHSPVGLTNNYQFTDFYGEGISGILTEKGNSWFYKNNLGDIDEDGQISFSEAKPVIPKPSLTGLTNGTLSLRDLEANGEKQIMVNGPGLQGFYELTEDNTWNTFQPFTEVANVDIQDPNIRLIDLTGNGQPDLVMTEENVFTWYAADGKKGHKPADRISKPYDEEIGPALVFADTNQKEAIYLADMTGDGLTDIVRVRNSEICYWANKGYGHFSAKVTMGNAPIFDYTDQFDPRNVKLADISGTGATDVIYLGQNTFSAYINLSGNSWSKAHEINPFFQINRNAQVTVIDLLGTGTSCLVWSSDLPGDQRIPMRYIDLMDSRKPHVLIGYRNNMGKETALEYKSSTYFYLKDKADGKPWITKLPFPVQVIARSTIEDKITQVRFTTDYRYHHGYYDHVEREFRGFGMVEQQDSEFYETWSKANEDTLIEKSERLFQQPVLTKTWFHTGAFLDRERILNQFENEYWYETYNNTFPDNPLTITEPALSDAQIIETDKPLSTDEWREALRACKGMVLRKEVFAMDGIIDDTDSLQRQAKPYKVSTHNSQIQLLQPKEGNRYAVLMPTESETLSIQYERDETDPRIAHTLNIEIDELGHVLKSASVVYPRHLPTGADAIQGVRDEVLSLNYARQGEQDTCITHLDQLEIEQNKTLIIYTLNELTEDIIDPDIYLLRLPAQTKTFEITGLPLSGTLFQISDFEDLLNLSTEIAYNAQPSGNLEHRLFEHIQTTYYNDDLTQELFVPGSFIHGRYGIPYQSYQLAYTPELLLDIFGDKLPSDNNELENLLSDNDDNSDGDEKFSQCRFVHRNDNNWWIRSGITRFYTDDPSETITDVLERFFTPQSYLDPFGSETKVTYYGNYFMMMESSTDALENKTEIQQINFRTLSVVSIRDINHNISEVLLDELGLPKAMAVFGKGDEADNLNGLSEITTEADRNNISNYFTSEATEDLRNQARQFIGNATERFVYDFDRYKLSWENLQDHTNDVDPCAAPKLIPTTIGKIIRETHVANLNDGELSDLQLSFEYSDGMGNVVMTKAQAEPGEALQLEIQPDCTFNVNSIDTSLTNQLRWIGNGRKIRNNKSNPVKQYEPYFSVNPFYEDAKELVEQGVTPIIYYDALGRNELVELPDGTFTSVEFDAWQQHSYDQNDNIIASNWHTERISMDSSSPEHQAAIKSEIHNQTPNRVYLDTLGRPILNIEHNRWLETSEGENNILHEELYGTFITLDIEGNASSVVDARGNQLMNWKYDMLGHRVYQESMDAGRRWMLNNVAGNPIKTWDEREHQIRYTYDELQRPLSTHISGGEGETPLNHIIGRTIYGEDTSNAIDHNLRGQVFQLFDTSGMIQNNQFDFKGNLLEAQRRLVNDPKVSVIDWPESSLARESLLEAEIFSKTTTYDAINRMVQMHNWNSPATRTGIYLPNYNERGVLQSENFSLGGETNSAIVDIKYNEKGQRILIRYGNDTSTRYHYDAKTYRLKQLRTTRPMVNELSFPDFHSNLSNSNVIQQLNYTYDPVGNITEIYDEAYEPEFFSNQEVEPRAEYTHDALYRLIEATGRENNSYNDAPQRGGNTAIETGFPMQQNGKRLRNYRQKYNYDATGNFILMQHIASVERWTRHYETATNSNRLERTFTNNDPTGITYTYDNHGSMLNFGNVAAPYLPNWDYRDMISHINLGEVVKFGINMI